MAPTPLSRDEQAGKLLEAVAALYAVHNAKASGLTALTHGWTLGFDVKMKRSGSANVEVLECGYDRPALCERTGITGPSIFELDKVEDHYASVAEAVRDTALRRYEWVKRENRRYISWESRVNNPRSPADERVVYIRKMWEQYIDVTVKFSPRAAYAAVKAAEIMFRAALVSGASTSSAGMQKVCNALANTIKSAEGIKDLPFYELRVERIVEGTTEVDPAYIAARDLWAMKKQEEIDKLKVP